MRRALALALGGALVAAEAAASDPVAAGDPAAGKALAGQCRVCHGLDGVARMPLAPHIGGERAEYLARQLAAFRDGTRLHETMSVSARGLTGAAIADLAAWYAAQVPVVTPPAGFDASAAPELCASCHGADGVAATEDAPNLAGESPIYILAQLDAFRKGARVHETMTPIATDLAPEDGRAAAEWYGAIGFDTTPPAE